MKEVSVFRNPLRAGHDSASLVRRGMVVSAVALLVFALVAACGGSDDSNDAEASGPEVSMATFTPVPPDYTPEAAQTQEARATAFIQTATAQADVTPTVPSSDSPSDGSPRATPREGEIRPPDAILKTTGGETTGTIGNTNFLDPELGTGANVSVPYVPLPTEAVGWASGAPATIEVPNSPYPVQSAMIELYSFDENVAKPTSQEGVPTGELAFFPQTPPAQQVPISGSTINLTANVPPGNYIVSARIVWQAPPEIVQQFEEQFTQYVYVVRVG